jgi:mannosyl-3-phosphoglycerate phosphatase
MKKIVIFTDLDGTLLDSLTYSYSPALPALELLVSKNIPLVISSSKTKTEIEHYRNMLGNIHPFISENGGGIFIPKGYFDQIACSPEISVDDKGPFYIIRLGASYPDLRKAIGELRKEGFRIKGFGDMSVEEVAKLANMGLAEAAQAKERDFDEPFVAEGDLNIPGLMEAVANKGFHFTQGRFFHILGDSDKGKAVKMLKECYMKKSSGGIITIALGDSPNDIPMLGAVDYPVVVQKPDGAYDARIILPRLIKAEGIGPEGWNKAVVKLIAEITG